MLKSFATETTGFGQLPSMYEPLKASALSYYWDAPTCTRALCFHCIIYILFIFCKMCLKNSLKHSMNKKETFFFFPRRGLCPIHLDDIIMELYVTCWQNQNCHKYADRLPKHGLTSCCFHSSPKPPLRAGPGPDWLSCPTQVQRGSGCSHTFAIPASHYTKTKASVAAQQQTDISTAVCLIRSHLIF